MPVTWAKKVTSSTVTLTSSQGCVMTIKKGDPALFDLRIVGPFTLIQGPLESIGAITDPESLIANIIAERQRAGEVVL